ncbi:nuclear transport factor 2 family protein [Mycobacterium sp. M23085]|uniref:nuclear transport factor 2 family protein n=1 Tax=Mycobacterium sp. M23085 TaxID=3378087 RepID=UPI003878402B
MVSLSTDDKIAIQELAHRQLNYLDTHDVDSWADCWIPDGKFIATYGDFEGHEAIKEFIRGHIAAGKEDGARHLLTNYVIESDGDDRARVSSLVLKVQVVKPPFIIASGVYNDVVVRTPAGWKFESRRLDVDPGAFAAAEQAQAAAR